MSEKLKNAADLAKNATEAINNANGIKSSVASAGAAGSGAIISGSAPVEQTITVLGVTMTSTEMSGYLFVIAAIGLIFTAWQSYVGYQRMLTARRSSEEQRRANDLKERELNGRDNNDT